MKKAKAKSKTSTKKTATKRSRKTKKAVDLAEVRKDITNIVGNGAAEMTRAVVGEAKKGELAPVKYLFEVAGLYPAASETVKPEEDSLARTLLRRLGLPEEPVVVAEDDAPVSTVCGPDADEESGEVEEDASGDASETSRGATSSDESGDGGEEGE